MFELTLSLLGVRRGLRAEGGSLSLVWFPQPEDLLPSEALMLTLWVSPSRGGLRERGV